MERPPNHLEILQQGIGALHAIAEELREGVDRGVARPEQELTLRDVTGLAVRLAATSPGEWRTVWADHAFTGQDVGVLSELVDEYEAPSPYRDDPNAPVRQAWAVRLRALRDFLEQWDPSEHTFDVPDDFNTLLVPEAETQDRDQQQN
jgi:hypothetical protein